VPVGGIWTVSGTLRVFGANDLPQVRRFAACRRFLDACSSEPATPDTDPATIRKGARLAPDSGFPPAFLESADITLFHHPVKSISFLAHYGELEDAHRVPPRDTHDSGAVRGFVEVPTIPAYVLQAPATRFPGTVNATCGPLATRCRLGP
jgi:hypothetical protein